MPRSNTSNRSTSHRPRHRRAAALCAAVALACAPGVAAQETPKTSWGVPDLQGTWDFRTLTPMQRPEKYKDRAFLTPEEAAAFEKEVAEGRANPEERTGQSDVDQGYNTGFLELGTQLSKSMRTSQVVDPPDGRLPALTDAARLRYAEWREAWSRAPRTAADRPPSTRCLIGFNAGPPMASGAYNNNMRLFQAPGYVAILNEMVNEHRIIPLDGRDHVPANVRLWKGDSRGRWEGDTLVVETVNFTPHTTFSGTGMNMHLTERFTRIDADTLGYEYTVDDPEMFEAPWSVETEMRATDDDIYEYACHEGNYAMRLMLSGARRQEQEGVDDDTWLPSWYKWMPTKAEVGGEE